MLRLPHELFEGRQKRERRGMEQSFLFQQPPSVSIRALPLIGLLSAAYLGFGEFTGKHLQYSKFWNFNSQSKSYKITLSSKTGMLLFYGPAFIVAVASFGLFPYGGRRFLLVKSALTIHFFKRIIEVLFIHKFSGGMFLDTTILVSVGYFSSTATLIYVQHLSEGFPEPSMDLKYLGVLTFLVGIFGNFYHHNLLSKLREKGDKGYKLPQGGLFNLVVCPHYLFEILGFWGLFFVSQTLFSLAFAFGTAIYLAGRSFTTRKWYLSKFDNFPRTVKALVPFVF